MTNQLKHNSPSSVLSQFTIVASLKPKTRRLVNEQFIKPIVDAFFTNKGGVEKFCELDSDKLKTEIEFSRTNEIESFVKSYIYKEIINEISKEGTRVIFKPKYVVTFDSDLAGYKTDETTYPYKSIFNNNDINEEKIEYGTIRLGESPILYYILINLQRLIRFIKTLPEEFVEFETDKLSETDLEVRNRLLDNVILDKQRQLKVADINQKAGIGQEIARLENVRQTALQGQGGKLRINLAWNTTDDLDLYIISPGGTISYKNRTVENEGVIGVLDVDQNAGNNIVSNPQENINFDSIPVGLHKIYVNFFYKRENDDVPFTVTIIPEGEEGRIFNKVVKGKGNSKDVVTFEYTNGEINYVDSN